MYGGRECRKLVQKLKNRGIVDYSTVTFKTDGAPVFVSSSCLIWPILLIRNEIPSQELIAKHRRAMCYWQ